MSKLIFCKFLSKYKCARVYGVDSQWYGLVLFFLEHIVIYIIFYFHF